MAKRILIVDDDPDILEMVELSLKGDGFIVTTASSRADGMKQLASRLPDLVILDVSMETYDAGHQLCRDIRAEHDVPIIFLTSRADEIDLVVGLSLGADDYVAKPFRPRELVARVHANLRRATGGPAPKKDDGAVMRSVGEFVLDELLLTITTPQGDRSLSRMEFVILRTLAQSPGVVFSRDRLIQEVYEPLGQDPSPRTVDSHIRRLRAKMNEIGEDCIDTVRGAGYRLSDRAIN